jgi:outer membrane protein, heavy metal efflux system
VNTRRVFPLAFALQLLLPAASRAQESPAAGVSTSAGVPPNLEVSNPLRLEDVLASVERSYPLLRAAEIEQAIAASDRLSAEGGFDVSWKTRGSVTPVGYYDSVRVESMLEQPTALWGASTFAGWKLGTGEFPVYDERQQTLEYGEFRAGVNVPLWRNGPIDRRRATLARAELGTAIAQLSVAEQRISLRRAAAHRYWAWVASGTRLRIAAALLQNVEGRDAGLAARVERGDLPPIERTDNARAVEQRKSQVALAQRGVEQAAIELALFLRDASGKPSPPSIARLPSSFPDLPAALEDLTGSDFSLAQAQRPEAKRFGLQLRQNQIELEWAKNQLAPSIDLQLVGSQDLGRSLAARPDLRDPVFEVALLLDIPLQTRLMSGRADAASATVSRLNHLQQFARERIDADVLDAHSALRRARERIDAARREVKLALELEEGERIRFDHGDSHLLIVNIREQQSAEAELREVDALLDFHRAAADLKAARGE